MYTRHQRFAPAILAIAFMACASTPAASTPPPAAAPVAGPSLYERLGKKEAITVVVDDFAANILRDPVIKDRFASTDAPAFKGLLVDQICEATGGPCKYKGQSMAESHTGRKIAEKEWVALVGDLKKALDKNKVPAREQGELIGALATMHDDVVNR
jgi:hemoglobin